MEDPNLLVVCAVAFGAVIFLLLVLSGLMSLLTSVFAEKQLPAEGMSAAPEPTTRKEPEGKGMDEVSLEGLSPREKAAVVIAVVAEVDKMAREEAPCREPPTNLPGWRLMGRLERLGDPAGRSWRQAG